MIRRPAHPRFNALKSGRWRKELHIAAAAAGSGGEEGRTRAGAPLLTCAHCRSPTCVPWVVAARAGCRSPTCSDDDEEPVPSTTVLARRAPSSPPDVKPPLLAEDRLRCGRPIVAAARGRGSVARSGARPRTQDAAGTRGPSPRRRGRVPPCRRPGVAAGGRARRGPHESCVGSAAVQWPAACRLGCLPCARAGSTQAQAQALRALPSEEEEKN